MVPTLHKNKEKTVLIWKNLFSNFYVISSYQVISNRRVEQHLNESTSIVIYSPLNRANAATNRQQTTDSCIATYTISGNPTTTNASASNNGNDQGDSPLLTFCSVTNTLLNQ